MTKEEILAEMRALAEESKKICNDSKADFKSAVDGELTSEHFARAIRRRHRMEEIKNRMDALGKMVQREQLRELLASQLMLDIYRASKEELILQGKTLSVVDVPDIQNVSDIDSLTDEEVENAFCFQDASMKAFTAMPIVGIVMLKSYHERQAAVEKMMR